MRKLIALLLILATTPAFATFGAASAWDVRTTGVDTNGGAFDSGVGSPGTNESLGSGTAITVTLTGTTTGTGSPVFSSTTHGPGNFVHIASGSGCTLGWFEVLSQAAGVATFDHAMGVATNVCVGTIGGSLLTIQQANTNSVASNTIWIQSGTYTFTTVMTLVPVIITLNGYATSHGDNGTAPLITTATNSTSLIDSNTAGPGLDKFVNLAFSNTAGTSATGIYSNTHGTSQIWLFINDTFTGFTNAIDNSNGPHSDVFYLYVINCNFINNTTWAINSNSGNPFTYVFGTTITATTATGGITFGGVGLWIANTTISCTTVCTFGINTEGSNNVIEHVSQFSGGGANTAGIDLASGTGSAIIYDTIVYGNTVGILLNSAMAATPFAPAATGASGCNAYGGNTSDVNNWVKASTDVTLSANPYTSSTNFALNSTAGGGAALKGAGCPGLFPGGVTTSHPDIGAVQSAGGGGAAAGNFGVSN